MNRNAGRGFSLLEVLVAFTILVMILAALFQVFGSGLRAATVGDQYTRATLIAQSKLAELTVDGNAVEGVYTGEVDDGYRWQATVRPFTYPDAPPTDSLSVRPLTVSVDVSWQDGLDPRTVSLATMVLATRQ